MSRQTAARPRHIGINAQLLSGRMGYRRAGIHHYIAQLLDHLPQEEPDLRYTVFTGTAAALQGGRAMQIAASRWPTGHPLGRILWEQLAWPALAAGRGVDLLHALAFVTPLATRRPSVVTVYDLSFLHYPERFRPLQRLYLTSQTRRSAQAARRVAAISETGRQDLQATLGLPLAKIDVVRPGVDEAFGPRPAAEVEAFRARQGMPAPFILHVGTLQPRKNLPVLLEAMALMRRPDVRLALVGGKGWYYDEIFARVQELGLEGQVRFPGYVTDADLPLWYNAAAVLVFPSLHEGFGMPVAQAMACGTPVIAARTSAVPEVAGDAALLFEPDDVSALAEHLAAVLDDPDTAAAMGEQGRQQSRRFSWRESGQEMVRVYRRALAGT